MAEITYRVFNFTKKRNTSSRPSEQRSDVSILKDLGNFMNI
jgi:hypothetical protein